MILSARVLNNCTDPNSYVLDDQVRFNEGDALTVYIQLTDISLDSTLSPPGRRYVPQDGSSLQVQINPLGCGTQITRQAQQPFPGDASIWRFQILPTDGLRGTQDLRLQLLEGTNPKVGVLRNGISAQSRNSSFERY